MTVGSGGIDPNTVGPQGPVGANHTGEDRTGWTGQGINSPIAAERNAAAREMGTTESGQKELDAINAQRQDRAKWTGQGINSPIQSERNAAAREMQKTEAGQKELDAINAQRQSAQAAAGGTGQDYTNWSDYVDPATATTQGQMQGLLDPSNPLMQRRVTQELQGMNSRGLQNSSMTSTAVTAGLLDEGFKYAQQDASMYAEMQMKDMGYDMEMDFADKKERFDRWMVEQELDADKQQWMTSAFADATGNWANNMTRIMTDPNMSAADKQAMLQQGRDWINSSIETWADLNGFDYEL